MALPVLVAVSSDTALLDTLQTELGQVSTLRTGAVLEDVLPQFRDVPPRKLLVDFRPLRVGGHVEVRLLSQFQERFPQVEILALTGEDCPEPLERHIACNGVRQFRGPLNTAALVQALVPTAAPRSEPEPRLPSPASLPAAPLPAAPRYAEIPAVSNTRPLAIEAPDSEFVIAGLTRRFETNTPALKVMLSELEVAARHDVTVLLIGETGAGKTFLSKLIHEISPRRKEPFLPVACGALPNDLIESELFGHVKGAFTSAHADKEGKFVAARSGTILLDEIDVLGLEQQVKLLRVIESGEFEPVGSNRTLKSEARLIVASNLELQPLVEQGRFRPDLYYRLNMLKFVIPPLRQRRPDIVPMARKFIREQAIKHNVRIDRIDDSLFVALHRYPWPGNMRELEHVIQRAVIYCSDGYLSAQHLPSHVVMCQAGPSNDGSPVTDRFLESDSNTLGQQVAYSEREIIEQALFKNNYSRTGTARALGISRVTLYNKMKKYGMTR